MIDTMPDTSTSGANRFWTVGASAASQLRQHRFTWHTVRKPGIWPLDGARSCANPWSRCCERSNRWTISRN